jgi:hypothetical protein
MSHDPAIRQAYAEVAEVRRWRRERESPKWKLAQASVINRLPLNGPAVLKHATNPQAVGKRTVCKRNKT